MKDVTMTENVLGKIDWLQIVFQNIYEESSFDSTLNWYQYQGGFAVTQAIYFLVNHGLPIQPKLIGKKEHYVWSPELAEKLLDFVTQHQRMDLIPLIQNKTKNRSIKKIERSPK